MVVFPAPIMPISTIVRFEGSSGFFFGDFRFAGLSIRRSSNEARPPRPEAAPCALSNADDIGKIVRPERPGKIKESAGDEMRFILAVLGVVLLALIGLFIYAEMLEPETHPIEQEAVSSGDA
jgi:hypothetical protein